MTMFDPPHPIIGYLKWTLNKVIPVFTIKDWLKLIGLVVPNNKHMQGCEKFTLYLEI